MVHYLDHAASTPLHPAAIAAMTDVLTNSYGNPSGAHRLAREANRRLDEDRATVAAAFGWSPGNIVFTSGGTEADSFAVNGALGLARFRGRDRAVAVCSSIEHHAVLDPVEKSGGPTVSVDSAGRLDLDDLRAVLEAAADVAIVSIMAANNETGVVQPVVEATAVVRELAPRALVHTDAVQFAAWRDCTRLSEVVDLMSVSAHKIGGPKGIGFLAIADRVPIAPIQIGGGQERARRAGTQNTAGIAGMAAAAAALAETKEADAGRILRMRDRLIERIRTDLPDTVVTGEPADRLPNIAHLCFAGVESEALLLLLEKEDVMASAASSCASGAQQASHVLSAMAMDGAVIGGAIRLSLGCTSSEDDVEAAAAAVVAAVKRIRG